MKSMFARAAALVMALLLAVPGLALAETEIPAGQVVELTSGETYLFGSEALAVEFEFDLPDNENQTVRLRVGGAENSYSGWYLEEKVYAARLDGHNVFLLVGDYGPSDDDWTEIFYYNPDTRTLADLGGVGALPENLQINADGTFSGVIRADALCTWYRPADFRVATAYMPGENGYTVTISAVVEAPRYSYPMGGVAYPTMDIPVYASTDFEEIAFTVPTGARLLFGSTDDATWVQVEYRDEANYETLRGYLQLDPEIVGGNVLIGGESYGGYEIFPGLLYAD
ncbi:MAG TPA: hypothetical protein IAA84_04065 [Candidatus Alectryocaccomicrobium excrementavium]|uniref:Peptidase S9 prolyl oligopeptidase catalytic domain-containing protein n=1 Tax=Candidatus Alectryocaccomicrobium excrementavium TaxID=2840668 RepID=A0A9D1K6R8_9FIRM|nr:hypothetical protein [Candidatus Alectryocaccomicrobium excrementavium]